MPAPSRVSEFLDLVERGGLLDQKQLDAYLAPGVQSENSSHFPVLILDAAEARRYSLHRLQVGCPGDVRRLRSVRAPADRGAGIADWVGAIPTDREQPLRRRSPSGTVS